MIVSLYAKVKSTNVNNALKQRVGVVSFVSECTDILSSVLHIK